MRTAVKLGALIGCWNFPLARRPIGVTAALRSIAQGQLTDAPMPRTMIAATLAALTFIPAFVPHSAAAAPSQYVVVTYGDLDLGAVAGRRELNNRVRTAAGTLCSPVLARRVDSEPSIRRHQILYDACVGGLTDRAMRRIDARL